MSSRLRALWRSPLFWMALLTAASSLSLATGINPYPSDPQQWRWPGRPPSPSTYPRWWPALLVLALYVALIWWVDQRCRVRPRRWLVAVALAAIVIAAPLIQLCLVYIHNPYPIALYLHRTIGPLNGFWQIATANDSLVALLRDYPALMRSEPYVHTATHPPGPVLWVWLVRAGYRAWPAAAQAVAHWLRGYNCQDIGFVSLDNDQIAAATAQMVIPLFSGLVALPLFALGKRLDGTRSGLRAASLVVIVPALTLFTMRWDQLYPFALCLALLWLRRALDGGRLHLYLLAGCAVSAATFMSFGNLTILPALALLAGTDLLAGGIANWRRWLSTTWLGWLLFAAGAGSLWLAYQALSGSSFWTLFTTAMGTHLNLGRTYWIWALLDPYEFLMFAGVPLAVLFVAEAWRAWREALRSRWRALDPGAGLALAVSATLVLLVLSGITRGEVGRLWLLWMAPACLIAALALRGKSSAPLYRWTAALLAFSALMFTLFLRVSATGLPAFQPRQPLYGAPADVMVLDAQVGQLARLVGVELPDDPAPAGSTLRATLYWQPLARADRAYTVFVHLLSADGHLVAQQDGMPVQGSLPTTCWQAGETIADERAIALPADLPAGGYTIAVGVYDGATGLRLPAFQSDVRQTGDSLVIASLEVPGR